MLFTVPVKNLLEFTMLMSPKGLVLLSKPINAKKFSCFLLYREAEYLAVSHLLNSTPYN